MFFNYLRIFVWGFGGFIVFYTGWAIYKTFNTPDYKTELFEKFPVQITLELIESDKRALRTVADPSCFEQVNKINQESLKLSNDTLRALDLEQLVYE